MGSTTNFWYIEFETVPNIIIQEILVINIRQRIKLQPHISIYLMINGFTMPATSQLLGVIYNEHSDDDGFMYITYTGESTFG